MTEEEPTASGPIRLRRGWRKHALALLLLLLAMAGVGLLVLDSPIGYRLIADRIAAYAPASGLRVKVGRIEGSLYGQAVLRDVTLSDPKGPFLRVPVVELDWRPFNWYRTGLDVRKLVARRGLLLRSPELNPGDPDAPILPKFDLRVDRFELDRLTIDKRIAGEQRRVDLVARVDIRSGRALIRADGRLGGSDRLFALLDAAPDRDKFDLKLDYTAPKGGVLAGLTRAKQDVRARIVGAGSWRDWKGALLVEQGGGQLAAFRLTNQAGRYGVLGQLRPKDLISGLAARAMGELVSLDAQGSLDNSMIDGRFVLAGQRLNATGTGKVDLAGNRFEDFRVTARNSDPALLGDVGELRGGLLIARLDGKFRDLSAEHTFTAARLGFGKLQFDQLVQRGTARFDGTRWTLPLNLGVSRVLTGNATIDPRLVGARGTGMLALQGSKLSSDDLTLAVPGLGARLTLRGDLKAGGYALAGPVAVRGFALRDLGTADATAKILFRIGHSSPWLLKAQLAGRMVRTDNATLTSLAGTNIRFAGALTLGQRQPLLIERGTLGASKLNLALSGRLLPDGRTSIAGSGRHADYGPFRIDASFAADGPRAVLVFASPLPAAGLKDVRVALSPIPQGFRIETAGGSRLGPFTGTLGLFAQTNAPTRIEVERLDVWKTRVTGSLRLAKGGADGTLMLAGGGIDGTVRLLPRGAGQGFDVALIANRASFGGENPLGIAKGRINASGQIASGKSTITGDAYGEGITLGKLFIGRLAANASLADGRGRINASLAGRRGSRFNLQLQGDVAPGRVTLLGNGDFAGQRIIMPRRAVLTAQGASAGGGWRLSPTQLDFGRGRVIASGLIGGGVSDIQLALHEMPLSLLDIANGNLGLGGSASGLVDYRFAPGKLPTGKAQLLIKSLSRSGLVLSSRPVDLALVAELAPATLETRAVVREGGETRGRMQGRITGLPARGTLTERLSAGSLFAQLRYAGPADALWRLVALEAFDLTGPVSVAADASGSLANPQIRGSLSSENMRLQSALVGSDIAGIKLRGRFAGSKLDLTTISGRVANGGTVSGSGSVDFTNLGTRAPSIDLRISAHNAQILARDDMAAAVTGPLRIISDGVGGTIAGRVVIQQARWQLGRAAAVAALPAIRTREINMAADIAPPRKLATPWRFLIDAAGSERIMVRGLGIDSEWSANIRLRGTTANPAVFGEADLVKGGYEFAGRRFEMKRGRIRFDGGSPPDPRLDIAAEAEVTGLTARVTVTGTSLQPEITFSSIPALPEEELLARLLFGDSITKISAGEAIQLGAALGALRSGGGLDPINKLRAAIGLDRLRIVGADAAIGRGTGVAAGKYLGRRVYAEIISDGRGYSATQIEFRVTSWLSLLASVSTIGRESANIRVSKDY